MFSKTIFLLLIFFALLPTLAQKMQELALPEQLSETETQTIQKEKAARPHVETTLKISDARLVNALKNLEASQYKAAVQDVDVYAGLIFYADAYARKLPAAQVKDRNHCLKKLEQAIFKQNRALDTIVTGLPFDHREGIENKVAEVKKVRLRALNDVLGNGSFMNPSGGASNQE